jgi:hypothetical protein
MNFRLPHGPVGDHINNLRDQNADLAATLGSPNSPDRIRNNEVNSPRDFEISQLKTALQEQRNTASELERRSQEALRKAFEREQKLRQQLVRLESGQIRHDSSPPKLSFINENEVDDYVRELKKNADVSIQLANERARDAENRAKAYKDSLVKAKMFKLHTALENMALDYSKKEKRFRAIIASLQADKNQLLEKLVRYEGDEKGV